MVTVGAHLVDLEPVAFPNFLEDLLEFVAVLFVLQESLPTLNAHHLAILDLIATVRCKLYFHALTLSSFPTAANSSHPAELRGILCRGGIKNPRMPKTKKPRQKTTPQLQNTIN